MICQKLSLGLLKVMGNRLMDQNTKKSTVIFIRTDPYDLQTFAVRKLNASLYSDFIWGLIDLPEGFYQFDISAANRGQVWLCGIKRSVMIRFP